MAEMYFAQKPSEDCAAELLGKINSWSTNLNSTGYLDKLKQSWADYYGAYYNDLSNGHQITFSGEQGELVQLAVNHYRNLASHMISLITQSRPAMDCRAINNDVKSINQAKLGNGILEYYLREKKLERYLQQAVEHAVVLGAGWIKAEWNATTGQVYDYMVDDNGEPDKNRPIYDGDIEFTNLSPFDVIVDGSKENNHHDWWTIRTFKNKYDLAAKYPEWSDKIIALPTKSDLQRFSVGIGNLTDMTSDIPVYEFYHRKTDSVPEGRYMLFVDETIVLQDIGLPYRVVPIFRISAGDIMGTPYGYSPMFDAMPIQENLNSIYSTVATNQNAFGVQNLWMPPGAEGDVANLSGGLNVIRSEKKPESIQLCQTPKEVFDFINMLKADMETLTSINSVVRGDPAASLRTGAALALVQSSALQFLSPLSRSYTELIEEIGTSIITILQDYAKTPRMVAIVGKSNKTALQQFEGTDIANICRVYVDEGNPLSKTIAGRMELAQQMIQYQVIKNPNQIIQVLETGRLDALDEDVESELNLMRDENETLMAGGTPQAIAIDDHKQHIWEHRKPLQDTELRKDPDLVKRVLAHIQQHIELLRDTDPQLLQLVMQQPLPPENPPGPPPGSPPQGGPPPQGQQQGPPGPQGPPPPQHRPPGPPHSQGAMGHNMPHGLPMAFQPPTQGIAPPQPSIPPRR